MSANDIRKTLTLLEEIQTTGIAIDLAKIEENLTKIIHMVVPEVGGIDWDNYDLGTEHRHITFTLEFPRGNYHHALTRIWPNGHGGFEELKRYIVDRLSSAEYYKEDPVTHVSSRFGIQLHPDSSSKFNNDDENKHVKITLTATNLADIQALQDRQTKTMGPGMEMTKVNEGSYDWTNPLEQPMTRFHSSHGTMDNWAGGGQVAGIESRAKQFLIDLCAHMHKHSFTKPPTISKLREKIKKMSDQGAVEKDIYEYIRQMDRVEFANIVRRELQIRGNFFEDNQQWTGFNTPGTDAGSENVSGTVEVSGTCTDVLKKLVAAISKSKSFTNPPNLKTVRMAVKSLSKKPGPDRDAYKQISDTWNSDPHWQQVARQELQARGNFFESQQLDEGVVDFSDKLDK